MTNGEAEGQPWSVFPAFYFFLSCTMREPLKTQNNTEGNEAAKMTLYISARGEGKAESKSVMLAFSCYKFK